MVQWCLGLANMMGLPAYVESSPSVYKLYAKMGLEILPEKVIHKAEVLGTSNDIEVPLMVYMPVQAGGMTFAEWRQRGFPPFPGEAGVVRTVGDSRSESEVNGTGTGTASRIHARL